MAVKSGEVMKDQGVQIQLDKKRTLKFDLNALCILQEQFDDIDVAFQGLGKRDFKIIRSLVYAVLAHEEDDSFTEKQAGALVTMQNITTVAEALAKALREAMPESNDNKGK
jgi:hypothetical protein